jgi:hypothetical protein
MFTLMELAPQLPKGPAIKKDGARIYEFTPC